LQSGKVKNILSYAPETWKQLQNFRYKIQYSTTIAPQSARTKKFAEFRKELEKEGLFKTNALWYFYKTTTTLGFLVLAMILVAYDYSLLGAVSLGIGFQQLGWLGHDYSHHQVFPFRKWNRWFGYLTGNITQGLSQRWWDDRHNAHHAITNVLDSDPDIDNLPLFAWSIHDVERIPSWAKPYLKYQQYYFLFPFCPLLRLIWLLQSFRFVWLLDSHSNSSYRSYSKVEQLTLYVHWIWYLTLLYFASNRLLFFAISQSIPGFGISIIVFFNHYACHHYKHSKEEFDFLDLVCLTTRDMEPGIITDWICGGLNYQIEHHMFPTMPRHHLSTASKRVKQFCRDNNLEYQVAPFLEGVGYLLKQLATVSETVEKMNAHEN